MPAGNWKPIDTDTPGDGEGLAELARQLAAFEIDDEPLADVDRQREVALGYAEGLPPRADEAAEAVRRVDEFHGMHRSSRSGR